MTELPQPLKKTLREPASSARNEAMWQNIRARRDRKSFGVLELCAISMACACALALLVARVSAPATHSAQRSLQTQTFPQPPSAAGPLLLASGQAIRMLRADRGGAARMQLSDGSRVELSPDTELSPRASTGTQMTFELAHGRALFDVVPHGPRHWTIEAGEVQVSVLGTRFSVERLASEVHVVVERGVVRVASKQETRELHAGDVLHVQTGEQPVAVHAADDAGTPTRVRARAAAQTPAQAFARTVSSAKDADALLTLADGARVSGQPEEASIALARLVERFPKDPRAALAALTLGRIYIDQLHAPAQAAKAFERANTLGLPTALAEEGAARVVEAHVKAGHMQLARAAAASYLARFADGRRRADVAAWVGPE